MRLVDTLRQRLAGVTTLAFGTVEVSAQVVAYLTREARTGRVLARTPLTLPARTLRTKAVWWSRPH